MEIEKIRDIDNEFIGQLRQLLLNSYMKFLIHNGDDGTSQTEVLNLKGDGSADFSGSVSMKSQNIQSDVGYGSIEIGGPSGGCIPAEHADTPINFESLSEMGAMMGSGGLVVLDDTDCMVDIARYFLSFTQEESCGKCTFCRVGTKRMLDILDNITKGKGKKGEKRRKKGKLNGALRLPSRMYQMIIHLISPARI